MPDNAFYMHAAYVLAGALYAGYVASLWLRGRREGGHANRRDRG